jgi:phosphoglycerate dehydrogenase-like enzyme
VAVENANVRTGGWQQTVGDSLHGKTLGILGLGNIGSEVARLGLAFGMEVIAWSQNLTPERAQACGARWVSKEELFRSADILTVHLVLSERTQGLVGAAELRAMKPTARLINTSRGPIVDETALIEALRERRIAGAALDVFDIEPLPVDHPFRSLESVLATPHIGYVARDLLKVFYGDTVKNVTQWLDQQG